MWWPFALVAIAAGADLIAPPASARLVGTSIIDEIRSFPELGAGMKMLPTREQKETLVGVSGVDRLFETDASFGDTVAYFDELFEHGGQHIVSRAASSSATAWSVEEPDGSVANAVVRNTTPTTIELAETVAASEMKQLPLH